MDTKLFLRPENVRVLYAPRLAFEAADVRVRTADFQRVDFAAIKRNTETLDAAARRQIANVMAAAVWKLIGDADRMRELLDQDVSDIAQVKIDAFDIGKLKAACKQALINAWELGAAQSRREIIKSSGHKFTYDESQHPRDERGRWTDGETMTDSTGTEVPVEDMASIVRHDVWYDRSVKSWAVASYDKEGNQVGGSTYVYTKPEALSDKALREKDVETAKARLADAPKHSRISFAKKPTTLRDNAAAYLDANGMRMAQNLGDGARSMIQQELTRAVRTGISPTEAAAIILDRLASKGFTDREGIEGAGVTQDVLDEMEALDDIADVPAYINTLVRTNTFEAMNEARLAEFTDPELDGWVVAFEYSAILDENTTEFCRYMDGRVYAADNEVWDTHRPPNHFNCRSLLIPITKASGWDGQESEPPEVDPATGFARCGCGKEHGLPRSVAVQHSESPNTDIAHDEGARSTFEYDESQHPRDENGRWTDGGGGFAPDASIKLSPRILSELQSLEVDTYDPASSSPEKGELVKQLEAGATIKGPAALTALIKALDNAIDVAEDNENGRLERALRGTLSKVNALKAPPTPPKLPTLTKEEEDAEAAAIRALIAEHDKPKRSK